MPGLPLTLIPPGRLRERVPSIARLTESSAGRPATAVNQCAYRGAVKTGRVKRRKQLHTREGEAQRPVHLRRESNAVSIPRAPRELSSLPLPRCRRPPIVRSRFPLVLTGALPPALHPSPALEPVRASLEASNPAGFPLISRGEKSTGQASPGKVIAAFGSLREAEFSPHPSVFHGKEILEA